mmetsp:Transcript_32853/g.84847  ORF Transcript_32853/g.84847 Transcript_32853/m.84847 type:complete len:214 (-) Transcript_32853:1198-1839(-)
MRVAASSSFALSSLIAFTFCLSLLPLYPAWIRDAALSCCALSSSSSSSSSSSITSSSSSTTSSLLFPSSCSSLSPSSFFFSTLLSSPPLSLLFSLSRWPLYLACIFVAALSLSSSLSSSMSSSDAVSTFGPLLPLSLSSPSSSLSASSSANSSSSVLSDAFFPSPPFSLPFLPPPPPRSSADWLVDGWPGRGASFFPPFFLFLSFSSFKSGFG